MVVPGKTGGCEGEGCVAQGQTGICEGVGLGEVEGGEVVCDCIVGGVFKVCFLSVSVGNSYMDEKDNIPDRL